MKHGPCRIETYFSIHDTTMARFRVTGFVESDTLVVETLGDGQLRMKGSILCAGGTVIDVEKYLDVFECDGAECVQTVLYSYNAKVSGKGTVFRYCSPHDEPEANSVARANYHEHHHKHRYDPPDENGRVDVVNDDDWPTLGEVIRELRGWLYEHYELAAESHALRD